MTKTTKTFNETTAAKPAEQALGNAASHGWDKFVASLIERGADLEAPDAEGMTPLMLAVDKGHAKCVQLLVDAGADVNAKDPGGDTALIIAADKGRLDCAEMLIAKGAEIDARRANGNTALLTAIDKEHVEFALTLIQTGSKADQKTPEGEPVLVIAAAKGAKLNTVCYGLINKGASADAVGPSGVTPLICAATGNNLELARFLVKKGADLDIKFQDKTAIGIAQEKHHREIVELLVEAYAERERQRKAAIQRAADSFSEGLNKPIAPNRPIAFKPKNS